MEELINEAERLYKNIDDIQLKWVSSTKDSDEEGQRFAIGLMHIAMNSVLQFLKCIIDRKDNIVDLGEMWHNNKDIPHKDRKIIAVACNEILCGTFMVEAGWYRANINSVKVLASWESIKKWAYVEDLLPRGGEA